MKRIWYFFVSLFKFPFSPNKRRLWEWAELADEKDVDKMIEKLKEIVEKKREKNK